MEKIITLKSINDLSDYSNFDSYLVESVFSSFAQFVLSKEELIDLIIKIHSLNKMIYLKADKILIEKEIKYLDEYKDIFYLVDGVFFEDFAFATYFEKENINTELVYYPFDAIGDIEDIKALLEQNVSRICIPGGKEYLLDYNLNHKLGYRTIYKEVLFYTRRKLLSLYDNVNEIDINKNRFNLTEKTRTSIQEIIETDNGTLILNDIKKFNAINKVSFVLYDTTFISKEDFEEFLKEEVNE